MPSCFWNLCSCPDNQPCVEHAGTGCSILNGSVIADPAQVEDANTRAGEVALGKLGVDSQRADAIVRELEARKTQLERERADLERALQAADSFSERAAVAQQARALERRYARLGDELKTLTDELHALGSSAQVAIAPLSNALVIPFSDGAGYCACYQAKLAQLAALSAQITTELANHTAATAAYNAARAAALPRLKITFASLGVFLLIAFIIAGLGSPLLAFLALLFTAVSVIGLAVQIGTLRAALLQSRTSLYSLWLSYYRVQTIPTCVRKRRQE